MLLYLLLSVATILGFFGLGLLSMGFLIAAFVVSAPSSFSIREDHRHWIRKTAKIALLAHIALLVIIVLKVSIVVANDGEGWIQAFIAHWLIDHLGEAAISVWLAYRTVSGGIAFLQGESVSVET